MKPIGAPAACKDPMFRSLFAYLFMFTAGLASAAAYFYSIHPEHVPENDFPRMRLDLEEAFERARRAKDAWDRPVETPQAPPQATVPENGEPRALPDKALAQPRPQPKRDASISGKRKQ